MKLFLLMFFWFGLFLNSVVLFPQIIKIIKNKNAKGLSAFTFLGFSLLQLVVVLHAYFHRDISLMIGMIGAFITTTILVVLIIVFRKKRSFKLFI